MKRVFLKLSGEALAGEKKTGFDEAYRYGSRKTGKADRGRWYGGRYRDRRRKLLERTYQRDASTVPRQIRSECSQRS